MHTFYELLNNPKLLKAVEDLGYTNPTEIQEKAIPYILNHQDMIAKSNTGTGKTAAFGLPLIQHLSEDPNQVVLIICPTRELVIQVSDELHKFCKYLENIRIATVYGGTPIDRQIRSLKKGVRIIVGTPGRLLDHLRRKTLKPQFIRSVVLDEADEMLDMGFRDDIQALLDAIHHEHQTVLFSATISKEIREIANTFLHNQVEIEVKSKTKTVSKVKQSYYLLKRDEKKNDYLKTILSYEDPALCIIFCNTKAKVDDTVKFLHAQKINCAALHGDIKQDRRSRIMKDFKEASKFILVASDVAARGIDVNNIDLVINYDIPREKELYIHRIGRTGRAGKEGAALSLIQGNAQLNQLKQLMKFTKADIEQIKLPDPATLHQQKREQFKKRIHEVSAQGLSNENLHLANELMKEGLQAQELLSALITLSGGHFPITDGPKKKEKKVKQGKQVEVKLNIGKNKNITTTDILNTLKGACNIKDEDIGQIHIRQHYSIVAINEKIVKDVLMMMSHVKIKNKPCDAYYYKKDKKTGVTA